MAARREILCDLRVADVLGHIIIWILLSIITLGFCCFLFPYSFTKYALNKTYVVENGSKVQRFQCDLSVTSQIGHAFLWFLLSIITFGLAFFIYVYKVQAYVLNNTTLVDC